MERKLASVQRVLALHPIENADAIELAQINGWQCVVKKGEFIPGALGVFFEIDAIPPDLPQLAFLWTSRNAEGPQPRPESFRIKTMRLRGALSQGLLMPLSQFALPENLSAGDDLTAALGVGKWEPQVPSGMGDCRGPFPPLVRKTDEMRVQSVPGVLDELRGLPYVITLKCDGTSATYCIDPRTDEFHACGRNQSITEGANHYWNIAKKYELEAALGHQFSLAFVSALLAMIGYSTNDTIIVFDRIREERKLQGGRMTFREICNHAINLTLSRTVITHAVTLISVTALWLLGTGVIKDIAFTMFVGIVTGTFSSIFIATPIMMLWHRDGKPATTGAGAKAKA